MYASPTQAGASATSTSARAGGWTRAYFILLLNQGIVTFAAAIIASGLVVETRNAYPRESMELPQLSITVLDRIGPVGVFGVALASIAVGAALAPFRRQMAACLLLTFVFLGTIFFLLFAALWAYIPLLILARDL